MFFNVRAYKKKQRMQWSQWEQIKSWFKILDSCMYTSIDSTNHALVAHMPVDNPYHCQQQCQSNPGKIMEIKTSDL